MEFIIENWEKIIAVLVAGGALFRAISRLTKNKLDDKVVTMFSKAVSLLGSKRPKK